jgi:hypothetical protein
LGFLPTGAPAAVEPGTEARDEGHEVLQQIFLARVSFLEDHQFPTLRLQERLNVGHAETGTAICVLNHEMTEARISEQREELRALVIAAATPSLPHSVTTLATGQPFTAQKAATRSA